MKRSENKSEEANLLIFIGWLMYATSYLGKVNYSANITQIVDFYHITKAEAGLVPTFFFFAYGIGQVVNGILCKKYNMKWMIAGSMFLSALINFLIGITTNFAIVKWLWLINGFTLSILWPTLIRLISESLPQKALGKSSVVLGTTVASGTIVIYALSSLYSIFDQFKLAFHTAAICDFVVAVIWVILFDKAVGSARKQKDLEGVVTTEGGNTVESIERPKGWEKKVFFTSVAAICFCAVGVNLIKDGLITWVPSVLKEEYSLTDSLSIFLTLFLPVIAIFGNACALRMHSWIEDYITHLFVVFMMMALFIVLIIGSLAGKMVVIMILGLVVVCFLASSLNSLITSIYPLFMRGKVNSGLFAGILNGFCYLGSTASSYGLGIVADNFGWMWVFWDLLGFCIAVAVVWVVYMLIKKSLVSRNSAKVH